MADEFSNFLKTLVSPATRWASITPDDDTDLTDIPRAIYIGADGNVAMVGADGTEVTFSGLAGGAVYPLRPVRIKATSTTATGIIGLY